MRGMFPPKSKSPRSFAVNVIHCLLLFALKISALHRREPCNSIGINLLDRTPSSGVSEDARCFDECRTPHLQSVLFNKSVCTSIHLFVAQVLERMIDSSQKCQRANSLCSTQQLPMGIPASHGGMEQLPFIRACSSVNGEHKVYHRCCYTKFAHSQLSARAATFHRSYFVRLRRGADRVLHLHEVTYCSHAQHSLGLQGGLLGYTADHLNLAASPAKSL